MRNFVTYFGTLIVTFPKKIFRSVHIHIRSIVEGDDMATNSERFRKLTLGMARELRTIFNGIQEALTNQLTLAAGKNCTNV